MALLSGVSIPTVGAHKLLKYFHFALATIFLTVLLMFPAMAGAKGAITTPARVSKSLSRTISFPVDSIGTLSLIKKEKLRVRTHSEPEFVGAAAGKVQITIPADSYLLLTVNHRVAEHPEVLCTLPPDAIDALSMSFISVADSDSDVTDKVLKSVVGLTGLRVLYLDRSDVTDAGLAQLKNLPHLRNISCFLTPLNGSCFKDLVSLPELKDLSVHHCGIDTKNIVYLTKMTHLENLDLSHIGLNKTGAGFLANCTNLKQLSLRYNPLIDDACIFYLRPLKHLEMLDLTKTKVTPAGIVALKGLPLKRLSLDQSCRNQKDEIAAAFPGIEVAFPTATPMSKNDRRFFAPLK